MSVNLIKELKSQASAQYAKTLQSFFKTGKGQYGEGDVFIGVKVPEIRIIIKKYFAISLSEIQKLLDTKINEIRLSGLLILNKQYEVAQKNNDEKLQKKIFKFYCSNFERINNWNLVDASAPYITGKYLLDKNRDILFSWAKSERMWTRRIAMVSNWWFIRKGDLTSIFSLAEILLNDNHDLMHKATGWMLREAYKKDAKSVENFLEKHIKKIPRTTLRYAIEKMPESKRKEFLKK